MPQNAAPRTPAQGSEAPEPQDPVTAPAFPAASRTLALSARAFAAGGVCTARFTLQNPHHAVLHIRLTVNREHSAWLKVVPEEVALGPGETQTVGVSADTAKARAAVRAGATPSGLIELTYQHLYPATLGISPQTPAVGSVKVQLPFISCPNCHRSLESAIASGEVEITPDYCPYCFERLRPCPVCGATNSWLAQRCFQDSSHIVRPGPDWVTLGGSATHTGSIEEKITPGLIRRWSFPSVPPGRREAALVWSAPVAAYGLVVAAAATYDGEAHLYGFDATNGAPLWDPYPLPDPVYPDRGGAALARGRVFAATVEGACVAVDAQRGTRIWETELQGRVYGAVTPAGDRGPILVAAVLEGERGMLYALDEEKGEILRSVPLPGPSDTAPAYDNGLVFVHDDRGNLTAVELLSGEVRWSVRSDAGFDAAPVVCDGQVFSINSAGTAWCHRAETGEEVWRMEVTNAPFAGTPAHDGPLLYMPANDGLHLFSASAGKAVRRYPLRMPIRSAPLVAGGTLFFGATDGNIYGASSGRPLEKLYETTGVGSQIVAAPAFSDGVFYFAATNGVLYALVALPSPPPLPVFSAVNTAGQGGIGQGGIGSGGTAGGR